MRLTRLQRALTRSSVVIGTATTVVLVLGAPAHAASLNVSITTYATHHYVCADGWGTSGTQYQFVVAGTRADALSPVIAAVFPLTSGSTYHQCYTVWKNGSLAGNYTATLLSYSGTSALPNVAVGDGTWLLGQDEHITTGG